MLRLVALALLLANLLYFGWTLGWLDAVVGIRALGDREPQRLQRQVQPEIVKLSAVDAAASSVTVAAAETPAPVASAAESAASSSAAPSSATAATAVAASAAASKPVAAAAAASAPLKPATPAIVASAAAAGDKLACLEAGPFDASELAAAEAAIRSAAPTASMTQRQVAGNGEWMIYMGPYPDDAWVERKKAELSRIRGGITFDVVGPTAQFGRGISLGRFASQAEADKRLEEFRPRGIRTARVIQSGGGPGKVFLRIAKADPALAERLGQVQLPAGKAGFTACAAPR